MLRLIFILVVWLLAPYAAAAEQVNPLSASGRDATLKVAHREVLVFRVPFNGADPQTRVARAESRLAEARGRR